MESIMTLSDDEETPLGIAPANEGLLLELPPALEKSEPLNTDQNGQSNPPPSLPFFQPTSVYDIYISLLDSDCTAEHSPIC